ncbi:MAG: hypothetical protein ACRDYY_01525, partial [Acidimicrobiales bacterium]
RSAAGGGRVRRAAGASGGGSAVNEYVAGGWGATAVILALYAWRTARRGRVLRRRLPDGEKTWR